MKLYGVRCKKCGYTVFSRARHDCRSCECGACYIDGGFDYTRVGGEPKDIDFVEFNLKVSKHQLFEDWNNADDHFGLISPNTRLKIKVREHKNEDTDQLKETKIIDSTTVPVVCPLCQEKVLDDEEKSKVHIYVFSDSHIEFDFRCERDYSHDNSVRMDFSDKAASKSMTRRLKLQEAAPHDNKINKVTSKSRRK